VILSRHRPGVRQDASRRLRGSIERRREDKTHDLVRFAHGSSLAVGHHAGVTRRVTTGVTCAEFAFFALPSPYLLPRQMEFWYISQGRRIHSLLEVCGQAGDGSSALRLSPLR